MIATAKLTKEELDEAIKLYMKNRGFKMHDNAAIRYLTLTESSKHWESDRLY